MVADGTFREDLFYRLQVIEIAVPPLRERREDIAALVDHFLTVFAAKHKRDRKTIERAAVRRLEAYAWPGNVRQLEHVLLNAWLLCDEPAIGIDAIDLPSDPSRAHRHGPARSHAPRAPHESSVPSASSTTTGKASSSKKATPLSPTRSAMTDERRTIEAALAQCRGNRVQAAQTLGIPRRTFYRRLAQYGLLAPETPSGSSGATDE